MQQGGSSGGLSVQGVCAEFVFENLIADIETITT